MKILIFSDSHGDVETMRRAVEEEKPEQIIHLGDRAADADKLNALYKDIKMIRVLGNTDTQGKSGDAVQFAEICGKRVMLTHGHAFGVDGARNGMRNAEGAEKMALYGFDNGADIILFGHSHEPYINCLNGKWIMNPGRIGRISSRAIHATYGVLEIENGNIHWSFAEAKNNPVQL